jgi:hypothetical protein
VARVIQARQLERLQRERFVYNKVTLTASEILVGVANIQFTQVATALYVRITLSTGSGSTVDLDVPMPTDDLVAT